MRDHRIAEFPDLRLQYPENWAMLASLIATCKMSDVNPVAYITDTLRALLDGYPQSRIEQLMPWQFRKASSLAA